MKYGFTIIYVSPVEETLEFYKKPLSSFVHQSAANNRIQRIADPAAPIVALGQAAADAQRFSL